MTDLPAGLLQSGLSRRAMLSVLGMAGAGAALAGCGAPGGGGANSLQQADMRIPDQYKKRTPVLFWAPWTKEPLAALQRLIDSFNKSQDDIVVVIESQESYATLNTKLSAAVQAKRVPDVVCFPEYQWLQFYFADLFVQLDPYFDDSFKLDNYLDAFLEQCQAAGKTYLVPFARSTPLFYYNKTAYQKAGLPEAGPKTWDDLADYAPELAKSKVAGKPMKAFAFGTEEQWPGQAGAWAWGGQYSDGYNVTIDADPINQWLDWQRNFIHADKFGYLAEAPLTDYEGGLSAGSHASTASLTAATALSKFDVGVAYMLGKTKETEVPTGGSGLSAIKSDSKERQDAAVELFKFLGKPEQSAQWHKDTGYVPIVKASAETKIVKDLQASNPNYKVAIDQLKNAKTSDRVVWFQAAVTEINAGMTKVYGDNTPAKDVTAELKTKLDAIMEKNKPNLEKVIQAS